MVKNFVPQYIETRFLGVCVIFEISEISESLTGVNFSSGKIFFKKFFMSTIPRIVKIRVCVSNIYTFFSVFLLTGVHLRDIVKIVKLINDFERGCSYEIRLCKGQLQRPKRKQTD